MYGDARRRGVIAAANCKRANSARISSVFPLISVVSPSISCVSASISLAMVLPNVSCHLKIDVRYIQGNRV
jgi:hypothetical protein